MKAPEPRRLTHRAPRIRLIPPAALAGSLTTLSAASLAIALAVVLAIASACSSSSDPVDTPATDTTDTSDTQTGTNPVTAPDDGSADDPASPSGTQPGSSTDNSGLEPDSNVTPEAPPPPANLRGVVYTDTEIELFWDRSDDYDIVRYCIERDGATLAELDVQSYYDNTLQPSTTYEYRVTAIDSQERLGQPGIVDLTTRADEPIITQENAISLLELVSTQLKAPIATELLQDYAALFHQRDTDAAPFDATVPTPATGYGPYSYTCTAGGQFSGSIRGTTSGISAGGGNTIWEDCNTGEAVLTGKVTYTSDINKQVSDLGMLCYTDFERFSWTDRGGWPREFNGRLNTRDGSPDRQFWTGTVAQRAEAGSTIVQSDEVRIANDTSTSPFTELTASLTVQSPLSLNKPLSVSTPVALRRSGDQRYYARGQLHVVGPKGHRIEIDAATGNDDTYRLRIVADNGTHEEETRWDADPWVLPMYPLLEVDTCGLVFPPEQDSGTE